MAWVSGPRGGHRGRNTGGRSESHPDDLAITPKGGELESKRSPVTRSTVEP